MYIYIYIYIYICNIDRLALVETGGLRTDAMHSGQTACDALVEHAGLCMAALVDESRPLKPFRLGLFGVPPTRSRLASFPSFA